VEQGAGYKWILVMDDPCLLAHKRGLLSGQAATFLMLFHQVPYLQNLGFPAGRMTVTIETIDVISLLGRFLFPVLGDHIRPPLLITAIFGLLAISALLLLETQVWWRIYLYIALFGLVFGALLPMRAAVMSQHFQQGALRPADGAAGDHAGVGDGGRTVPGGDGAGYDRLLRGTVARGGSAAQRSHTADPGGRAKADHAGPSVLEVGGGLQDKIAS
jgi:hypothetical protein